MHVLDSTLMMINNEIADDISPKDLILLRRWMIHLSDTEVTMANNMGDRRIVERVRQPCRTAVDDVEAMRNPSSRVELEVGHGGAA
jgi:hypothetical protein